MTDAKLLGSQLRMPGSGEMNLNRPTKESEFVVALLFLKTLDSVIGSLPIVRNVEVRRVTSRKSRYALLLRGFTQDPIQGIRLVDCTFDGVAGPDVIENVKGLTLSNVRINGQVWNETTTR